MDDFEPRFILGYWREDEAQEPYPAGRTKTHIINRETNEVVCGTAFRRENRFIVERGTNVRKLGFHGKRACRYCKQLVHRYYLYNTVEELEDEYVRARKMDEKQILF